MEEIRVTPQDEEPEEDEVESGGGAMSTLASLGCAVSVGVLGATGLMVVYLAFGDQLMSGLRFSNDVAYVVAEVEPGQSVRASDIVFAPGLSLDGAVVTEDQASSRVAKHHLYPGDPVLEHRLLDPGRREGVASLTPKGARSLWMKGNAGIDGLGLDAGDRIDVWKTTIVEGDTEVIAEGVQVMAYDAASATSASKLTIATTPEQSDAIAKARTSGAAVVVTLRADIEFPADEVPAPDGFGTEGDLMVARRTLQAGVAIAEGDLVGVKDPGVVPANALGPGDLVGKVPSRAIFPGERITPDVLAAPERGQGIGAVLPEGTRGIAVSVKHAPDEKFTPGTTVDVHKVITREPVETEVVASNVQVVGNSASGPECPCIVLLVDADATDTILFAREHGDLAVAFTESE